jgi:hypothetical protein
MLWVYTNFEVRRFRGFERLAFNLSPVTLISGRNNTGKTALLEALFMHASGPLAGATALNTLNVARALWSGLLIRSDGQTTWDSLFHNYETRQPVQFIGRSADWTTLVELSTIEGSASSPSAISNSTGSATGETYSQSIKVTVETGSEIKKYIQTATQQTFNQPSLGPVSVQFGGVSLQLTPAGHPLISCSILTARTRSNPIELAQRYSNLRVVGRQNDFIKALQVIEPRLRGLEVLVRDGQSSLYVDVAGHPLLPLALFGEGMVTVADLISLIYSKEQGVVLIDEIENGIHHSVLESLWWQIKRASRITGTQVIATTHSRECMVAAESAFHKDSQETLKLVRLWRDPQDGGEVSVTEYDSDEFEAALDLNLEIR